jgi:hypothetical protein
MVSGAVRTTAMAALRRDVIADGVAGGATIASHSDAS